jgi:hypothetical protein
MASAGAGGDEMTPSSEMGLRMSSVLIKASVVAVVGLGTIVAREAQPPAAAAAAYKCPAGVNENTVRVAPVADVIAAARRVVIDHKRENNQGRITRRTTANNPVIAAIELGGRPALPGSAPLLRLAAKRCGATTARFAWAVVFTDTNSVLCCVRDVVFVVHVKSGWPVFQ